MKIFFLFFGSCIMLTSCLKDKQLPDTPVIEFRKFDIKGDKATLQLSFTDGDGNFGLDQEDVEGAYAECTLKNNLFMEYYELNNGTWEHVVINGCDEPDSLETDVPYYYTVPWAKPTGQDQTQEGEIQLDIDNWFLESERDTVRYEIHLVDRTLNSSNTLIVGPFIKTN